MSVKFYFNLNFKIKINGRLIIYVISYPKKKLHPYKYYIQITHILQ